MRVSYLLSLSILALGCDRLEPTPTFVVEVGPFVKRVTAEGVLEAEKVTAVTVPPESNSALRLAWIAPEASQVERGDVVARFDPARLEERLEGGRSAYDSAGYRIVETRSESTIEQAALITELELSELELELARRFQRTDVGVWSRHEIVSSQIDEELASDRYTHATAKRSTQQRRTGSDLELLDIKQRQATREIEEAESGLAALVVRAPHAGLFTRARDWQGNPLEVGQELWRGRPIGEIPDLTTFQAEIFVLEADAGGLIAGLEAEVVVEARPEQVHAARVVRVDTVAQPRRRGSPVQYFGVTLALESTDTELMKPGQRVRAILYLARKDDALVVPRQAVERVGESYRLWVRDGDGFIARPVTLGIGTRALVDVTEGLKSGEVIALRPRGTVTEDEEAPEAETGRLVTGAGGR